MKIKAIYPVKKVTAFTNILFQLLTSSKGL